ncbi:hypothetical protein ACQ4PT_040958 [Festuca glaucescens]
MKPPKTLSRACLLLLLLYHLAPPLAAATDADALLALKSALDTTHRLPWSAATAQALCTAWPGVRQCDANNRVTKLVLENLNLTGPLTTALLAPLRELRVLSLKSNALSGTIPDNLAAALPNLKLLYLSGNRLQGRLPASLAVLRRATVLVLSDNDFSGGIPRELASGVPRLTALMLDGNRLTGPVPALPQPTLRRLDVSGNRLEGRIPAVLAKRFNSSSFERNAGLCGPPLAAPCVAAAPDAEAPLSPATAAFAPLPPRGGGRRRRRKVAIVVGSSVAGAVVLALLLMAAVTACRRGRNKRVAGDVDKGGPETAEEDAHHQQQHHSANAPPPATNAAAVGGGREFSWEREGIGKLVFCGGGSEEMSYSLEELLRASAETLGRGEAGSTYKAVMETGFIVTVKRMRCGDAAAGVGAAEFGRRAEELGRVRHPNVVALRAYFQAKEERLLVYDYYPNGSLFSLIHGSRPSSKGKPLHWTSCMKIAEDIAAGLLHLHQTPTAPIVHGNLKPSNVLLGPDFESCLTDYGLVPALAAADASSAVSLLYRAPETRSASGMANACFTPASDVYSFGVLLLELLTGRTPPQDLVELRGDEDVIPAWVRAAREEEMTESGGDSAASAGGGGAEEKLGALIGVAALCVAADPGRRPATVEVLRMVREARAEAMSSSNSSDRSPARWSDALVGAPPHREHGAESFAERD